MPNAIVGSAPRRCNAGPSASLATRRIPATVSSIARRTRSASAWTSCRSSSARCNPPALPLRASSITATCSGASSERPMVRANASSSSDAIRATSARSTSGIPSYNDMRPSPTGTPRIRRSACGSCGSYAVSCTKSEVLASTRPLSSRHTNACENARHARPVRPSGCDEHANGGQLSPSRPCPISRTRRSQRCSRASTSPRSRHSRSRKRMTREERIAKIHGGRWIRYARAEQIAEKLDELLLLPKTHRMPNLLIVGETNNGKTALVRRFVHQHLPTHGDYRTLSCIPVIAVQTPPVPDERRFHQAILTQIFQPFRPSHSAGQLQHEVLRVLTTVKVRMLVIDEIHHVLAG